MSNYYNRQWRLPNAWNGTESNVNKQSNYSIDFDGSSQYIDIVNSSTAPTSLQNIGNSNSYSISSWINTTTTVVIPDGANYYWFALSTILELRNQGTTGIHAPFNLSVNGGKLFFGRSSNYTTSSEKYESTTSVNTGAWVHCVATVDNNTLKFYINGSLDSTHTFTTATGDCSVGSNTANFFIGSRSTDGGGNDAYFDGQIDGVSVFNYALSSSQITTLYGSSSTGIGNPMSLSPKPVAYYPLGDQDSFNGSNYLVPNSSLKDYVFDTNSNTSRYFNFPKTSVGSDDFTFSFWVKPESYACSTTCGNTLLGNTNGTPSANQWNMWIYENDGKIRLVWYNQTSSAGNFMVTDFSFGAGTVNQEWVQVVLTRVGTTVTFYFNGVVDTATAGTLSSSSITLDDSSNATMRLPSPWGAPLYNQDGFYSNLLWHNVGLSSTEVETLYNNGSPIQTLANIPQNSNLQGWWKLDASATYDSSTTTWNIPDDSTNSNDGTSSGMTQVNLVQSDLSFTSGYSYALEFDGTNDYIDLTSDITLSGNRSISMWIKVNTGFSFAVLFGGDVNVFYPYIDTNNIAIRNNDTSTAIAHNGISVGVWYNFCVTGNGTTASFYQNGSLLGTGSDKNLTLKYINAEQAGLYGLNGSISNVSVWNAALTQTQVSEIYSQGIPQNLLNHSAVSSLVSWWQLGSNSSFNSSLNQWTCIDEKGTNTGESSQTFNEDAIVDGVGSYANGLSSGMGGDEIVGSAFGSSANSLSINMDALDRTTDTPS